MPEIFSFVPLRYYTLYFDLLVLVLIFFAFTQCARGNVFQSQASSINTSLGFAVMVFIVLYMGTRYPYTSLFGDTINYSIGFKKIVTSNAPFHFQWEREWFFYNMLHLVAKSTGDVTIFYLICALIYVGSLWLAMVRMFGEQYYIPFLVILSMFTFWSYGVNGVRNGMGASLFILAISYVDSYPIMFFLAFLASGAHKSIFLMIGAAMITWFIKNSRLYLWIWIMAVITSYLAGHSIQNYISSIGFINDDTRFNYYLTVDEDTFQRWEGGQLKMGFRWDFLAYSAIAVYVGYYFIFKRKFQDEYYHWLYNIYLLTNAFWVLVIRAAFSNRFAQISWFIMPVVLIYPFMKKRFFPNHELMTGVAILVFYAFAFFTNVVIPVIGILQK